MSILEKISKKIELIRRQPEHVRMRYVWGCVAVSMFIVLMFWIFSIFSMFNKENKSASNPDKAVPGLGKQLQTIKEQAPSLKDLDSQSLLNNEENDNSTKEDFSAGVESNNYSDL